MLINITAIPASETPAASDGIQSYPDVPAAAPPEPGVVTDDAHAHLEEEQAPTRLPVVYLLKARVLALWLLGIEDERAERFGRLEFL